MNKTQQNQIMQILIQHDLEGFFKINEVMTVKEVVSLVEDISPLTAKEIIKTLEK